MIIQAKEFQMPAKVEVEQETLSKTYGKFFAEPFERGFGVTLGNALRRILLSSIAGAAVTSVKIEGVHHEFSTIPDVKEDVTDIILNIKRLRLKMTTDKPQTIQILKKGPCEVSAKDILCPADIEILQPDLHIASLDKDAHLDMTMTVKMGWGYVPAERNDDDGAPIGVIPIDAIFTPIQKVTYSVEAARVGRRSDYDKLIMEIQTDGSVRPDDALGFAAKILKNHLTLFINFEDMDDGLSSREDKKEALLATLLEKPVGALELSVRAANCLQGAGIATILELVSKTEADMLSTKNFGVKSLNEIKEVLERMGLSLGMQVKS